MMLLRIVIVVTCVLTSLCSSQSSVLDDEMVELSLLAARLCKAMGSQVLSSFPGAMLYIDGPYTALFYENDDYCFLAIDTTTRTDLRDWWNNADPTTEKICPSDGNGKCCKARAGFQRSYAAPDYRDALDQEVIDCHKGGKEVVITGHSAGGAVAAVAAVGLYMTDPTIITFGQPASLVGDCPVVNTDKYYRFANTKVNKGNNLDYDPVPAITLTVGSTQIGKLFIMGDDTDNVVRYGNENTPSIISWGHDVDAHYLTEYLDRLTSYQGKDLGTDGWATGFSCNIDEECKSGKCGEFSWYWSSGKCR